MGLVWAWCPHVELFRDRSGALNLHPAPVRKTWKQGEIPDQANFGKAEEIQEKNAQEEQFGNVLSQILASGGWDGSWMDSLHLVSKEAERDRY